MELTTSRTIDAPIDRVWALQVDHEHWPAHLPNFKKVVRHGDAAFAVGSSASITQPGLGTVVWTVVQYDETDARRMYSWTGAARGTRYEGRHEVEALNDGRTALTLTVIADGGVTGALGWLMRPAMRKALEAEADAFVEWATSMAAT